MYIKAIGVSTFSFFFCQSILAGLAIDQYAKITEKALAEKQKMQIKLISYSMVVIAELNLQLDSLFIGNTQNKHCTYGPRLKAPHLRSSSHLSLLFCLTETRLTS